MKESIFQINSFNLHIIQYKTILIRVFGAFIFMFTCHSLSAQGDYISLGIGPSMLYADNSGEYRDFQFKIQPSITLSFNRQISEYVGIRGSIGAQNINSGDYDLKYPRKLIRWGDQDQAFRYKGAGYFADLTPIFTTNPNAAGKLTSAVQFYAGLGLGAIYVVRDQEILKNGVFEEGELIEGNIMKSTETNVIPYIPIRTGLSTNLSGNWDFALEFILITTLNSKIDGNVIKDKLLAPDMSGQIQFVVKRYFGQAW